MTIKAIKEKYAGKYAKGEKESFTVYDYGYEIGKVVIISTRCRSYGRTVWQAVRVADGAEMIADGDCRPCDNLEDAIDVAGEMFEMWY